MRQYKDNKKDSKKPRNEKNTGYRQERRPAKNEKPARSEKPVKEYKKEKTVLPQIDDDGKDEIIYGKNPVTELLKSGAGVDTVFIADNLNESVQAYYIALAKDCGAVAKKVHPNKLKALCHSENHQGIAAYASTVTYSSVEEIIDIAKGKNEDPFIIVCDDIEDPHNLGAIMRSAYLMGAHGVIIPKRGGVSVTGIVHKTSAGASMHLPVAKVANIAQTVRLLKENNIFVYCADMSDRPLYKDNLTGAIALVVGNEGKGVQPLVKSLCDGVVSIPMHNAGTGVDSFNASVAAGIIMYEISRQRENKK